MFGSQSKAWWIISIYSPVADKVRIHRHSLTNDQAIHLGEQLKKRSWKFAMVKENNAAPLPDALIAWACADEVKKSVKALVELQNLPVAA